jgi:enoyl-[acyl-carrier-protein] reductase (NADH)
MDVGVTAAVSRESARGGITGTTIYVDKGYHSMGMAPSHRRLTRRRRTL